MNSNIPAAAAGPAGSNPGAGEGRNPEEGDLGCSSRRKPFYGIKLFGIWCWVWRRREAVALATGDVEIEIGASGW